MVLAVEVDVNHLFFWDPILFEGTPFELNRVGLLMILASVMCLAFFFSGLKGRLVPKGMQNVGETAYLFVRNNIAIDVMGPEGAKYTPYLASLFFFIFFQNLLEIIPGINFPTTSRMAIPIALALITYAIYQFIGAKQGPWQYLKGIMFPPGVPWWVYFLLTPIELLTVFVIRPATLAIRLLANMMAGHVLLTIFFLFTHDFLLDGIDPLGVPVGILTFALSCALILFELMVILIQAYIFTTLSAFYIAESLHGHGHEEEHAATDEYKQPTTDQYETEGLKAPTAA